MKANVGSLDRVLRIVVGIVLLALMFVGFVALAVLAYEASRARSGGESVGPMDAVRLMNQGALLLDVRKGQVVIPEEALVPEQSKQYVYVVNEGVASRREVAIGARQPGSQKFMRRRGLGRRGRGLLGHLGPDPPGLVHGHGDEVPDLDLHDGAHAGHRAAGHRLLERLRLQPAQRRVIVKHVETAAERRQHQVVFPLLNRKVAHGNCRQAAAQPDVRQVDKIGRNDPCPCGSGKKYKHCHGKLS